MLASDTIVGDWIIRTGTAVTSNGMFTDSTYVTFPVKLLAVTDYHYMIWSPDRYLGLRQANGVQGMLQAYSNEPAQQLQRTNEYLYSAAVLIPCDQYTDWVRADKQIVEWISKLIGVEIFERLNLV